MNKLKIFILGATMILLLTGCRFSSRWVTSIVERELHEKWNKEFTVAALGDRWYKDTATTYVYANEDPSLRFEVIVNEDGNITFDNYSFRIVCRKVEDKINAAFEAVGLNSECFVDFDAWNYSVPTTCSIQEYISESGSTCISAAVVCKDNGSVSGEQLSVICNEISSEIEGVMIVFSIHVLSEDDYLEVKDQVRRSVEYFVIDDLRSMGADASISKVIIKSEEGASNKSNLEIDESLSNIL